jgi:hypothetical protein
MRVLPDRVRRTFGDLFPETQHNDIAAQRADKMHVVFDHKQRQAAIDRKFLQLELQRFGLGGVKPRRWLV